MKKVLISVLVVLSLVLAVSCSSVYTVKFMNGDTLFDAKNVIPGSVVTAPVAEPEQAGKTFTGWYKESACENLYDFNTAVNGNLSLYAGFVTTPASSTATVSFVTFGGTPVPAKQTVTKGTCAKAPTNPSIDGYSFKGWYTDSACTKAFDFTTKISADTVLYAGWTPTSGNPVLTVTFKDAEGTTGTTVLTESVPYGGVPAEPLNIAGLEIPEGYDFVDYWYSVEGTGTSRVEYLLSFNAPIYASKVVYPVFGKYDQPDPEKIRVSFETKGGTPVPETQLLASTGDTADEPTNDPYIEGSTFLYWYSTDHNTEFDFDTTITKDTVLYAEYSGNTVTVSFAGLTGCTPSSIPAQVIPYGGLATEPNVSKDGYTLRYWTYTVGTGESAKTYCYSFSSPVYENITLTPYFTSDAKSTYTVSFETFGGLPVPDSVEVAAGETVANPGVTPVLYGTTGTFKGWYKDSACTTAFVFDSETITKDTVIYAGYKNVTEWTVKYCDGDNELMSYNVPNGGYAPEPTTDPTKENCKFLGWCKDSGCKYWFSFNEPITGNTSVYAKWESYTPAAETWEVSFVTFGGTPVPETQFVVKGQKATKPATDPWRSGCSFLGWYDSTDPDKEIVNFATKVISGDTVLCAMWTGNTVTVEFDTMGGTPSSIPTQTIPYGGVAAEPVLTKDGCTLLNWYEEKLQSGSDDEYDEYYFSFDTPIYENKKVYAKWSDIQAAYSDYYVIENGVVYGFTKYGAEMVRATGKMVIPGGVTEIADGYFDDEVGESGDCVSIFDTYFDVETKYMAANSRPHGYANYVKTIELPASLTKIGKYAFKDMKNVTSIKTSGVEEDYSFVIGNDNLNEVGELFLAGTGEDSDDTLEVYLSGVKVIGEGVFEGCQADTIELPGVVWSSTKGKIGTDFVIANKAFKSSSGFNSPLKNLIVRYVENVGAFEEVGDDPNKTHELNGIDPDKLVLTVNSNADMTDIGEVSTVVKKYGDASDVMTVSSVGGLNTAFNTKIGQEVHLGSNIVIGSGESVVVKKSGVVLDLDNGPASGNKYNITGTGSFTIDTGASLTICVYDAAQFTQAIRVAKVTVKLMADITVTDTGYEFAAGVTIDDNNKKLTLNILTAAQLKNAVKIDNAKTIATADNIDIISAGVVVTGSNVELDFAEAVRSSGCYCGIDYITIGEGGSLTVDVYNYRILVYGAKISFANGVTENNSKLILKLMNTETIQLPDTLTVDIANAMSIYLNGKAISKTSENNPRMINVVKGDVKLIGPGTITAVYNVENTSQSSAIRVGSGSTTANYAVATTSEAKLDISGEVNIVANKCYGITVFGSDTKETVTIGEGVVITQGGQNCATGLACLSTTGNDIYENNKPTIVLTNVKMTSDANAAIYCPGGDLTINGTKGQYEGYSACIYFKGQDLAISGGYFVCDGPAVDYQSYGDGFYATGDALVVDVYSPNYTMNSVSVSGGTFKAVSATACAVGSYSSALTEGQKSGFITGGTFYSDPEKLKSNGTLTVKGVANGYTTAYDMTSKYWTVSK